MKPVLRSELWLALMIPAFLVTILVPYGFFALPLLGAFMLFDLIFGTRPK